MNSHRSLHICRWFSIPLATALATLLAAEASAVVLESHRACQKTLAKAAARHLRTTLKLHLKCDRERLFAPGSDPCGSQKIETSIAKADQKLAEQLTKGCGSLGDDELEAPRPEGLEAVGSADLPSLVRDRNNQIVARLVRVGHGGGGSGGVLSEAAVDCQTALDAAVGRYAAAAMKLVGTRCHDLEDAGKTATGEVAGIVPACVALAASSLDDTRAELVGKTLPRCPTVAAAEIAACPDLASDRTPESLTACVLDAAQDAGIASVGVSRLRSQPAVVGLVSVAVPGHADPYPASYGHVIAIGHDFVEIAADQADSRGRIELRVRPTDRVTLCLVRDGETACSDDPIPVGNDTVYFGSRTIPMPLKAGNSGTTARVLRADGTACFDPGNWRMLVQAGVVVSPTGAPPSGPRIPVSPDGEAIVSVPDGVPHTVHADCGSETVSVDLGPPPYPAPLEIHMTNPVPADGTVTMTDEMGTPITDPTVVQPGSIVTLSADVPDDDVLEYSWQITRGDGRFVGAGGNEEFASGQSVAWQLGSESGIHQVTVWASDGEGGIESIVATLGPIDVGPVLPAPCLAPPKLQKFLCATGYTAGVPTPGGGIGDFLSYKYRNPSRNSAGDACLYYNIVDPDCIDMNCDGVVDAGTDPTGKCKRMTLGGWWQKNGFDSNGLGSDVVTAWYLNSNDLGFGREMHCRVTSWSSIIAERPAGAPSSADRFVSALRSQVQSSPQVAEYAKLFNLYPSSVACYVTNYTTDHCFNYPTNDPQNADLAYQGQIDFVANPSVNPPNAYGTVAMEFGPVENFAGVGPVTKFFVYDGRTPSGKRLTAANLDGCGPKSVPELCMSCHGGSWPGTWSQAATLDSIVAGLSGPGVLAGIDANDTLSTDAGYIQRRDILKEIALGKYGFSSFVPFDPDTYVFPAAAPAASQAAAIRDLNRLVLYAKPVTPIRDLVNGWYSNNLASGAFAPWRPSGWNDDGSQPGDESDLHDDVYARACRVCHASHYNFASWTSFPASSRVCLSGTTAGGSPTMPHAKLTYLNLWKASFPQAPTMAELENWFLASEFGFTSCD